MSDIAERFIRLIAQLQTAIGVFVARQARDRAAAQGVIWLGTQAYRPVQAVGQLPPLPDAAWLLFWNRLSRLSRRFRTLFTQWRENRLPRPRSARPSRTSGARPASARLPTAQGWVNHRIPESAPPMGQLDALLHDPATREFVAAVPRSGRLLRPLCRALGVPLPAWLRLPKRHRPPRQRPSLPQLPPTTGTPDRPLPDYVRRAVRAWKIKCG